MVNGRRILSAVICGFIVTATAHADMVSLSEQDTGRRHIKPAYNQAHLNIPYSNISNPFNLSKVADLDSWSVMFLPQANPEVEETTEIQHLQNFTNGPGSLNLCLSALIGLGLCSSAHFVKRFSFSFVPEWYHNGGPFQIGHSYALSPDSLCPVPVYCFIQPVCTTEDSMIQHRWRTVVSIWRKSQFTPDAIASRGPPYIL
jgi:hypothetical protein